MNSLFLSVEDQQRVTAAIAAVEQTTRGEIVPMVVMASDTYPATSWRTSLLLTVTGCFILYFWNAGLFSEYAILAVVGFATLGRFLGHFPISRRLLTLPSEMDRKTEERAFREYFEHKISRTKERTGILIFLSLFERRAILLADEGINEKVHPKTWDGIVRNLTAALRDGRATEGLEKSIQECGEILSNSLPARTENPNELPNQLVIKF